MAYSVALRKESVDRNAIRFDHSTTVAGSLSARRAWIEMPNRTIRCWTTSSLSARRAWIEITL